MKQAIVLLLLPPLAVYAQLGVADTQVSFSATPTFTVTTSTSIQNFTITLTGNVTSSTLSAGSATDGQHIIFKICQDVTGSRTFAWPANVTGMATVDGTANTCSHQTFLWNGSTAVAITPMKVTGGISGIDIPGSTSGFTTVRAQATASGTITIPSATDTLVARNTTDTLTNKTLVAPVIASFTNATHNHSNSAGGGQLSDTAVAAANKNGNGSKFQMFTGPVPAADDCGKFDASGNIVGAGAPCGSGSGTGVGRISAAVNFSSPIPDGSCASNTFTWTGVTTSDTVIPGWPTSLSAGIVANMYVSAPNTVAIRECNFSGTPVTPGNLTYKATLAVYNLSGTGTIDFGSIADGGCLASTFSLTGVAAGDPVTPKWPSTLESGLIGSMQASATNTVEVRLCNWSGGSVNPASQSFGVSVAK